MAYMVEFVTKSGKLIKRVRAADKKLAIRLSELYIEDHPKQIAHIHLELGKEPKGYVRVKVITGKEVN